MSCLVNLVECALFFSELIKLSFRKDINGLRAIAVIAVVLFHFNPTWLPGGFAGVDVFFVISGFLMTGIIYRGLENKSFSLVRFYVARANRIIPALAVLCLSLLTIGWFILPPIDFTALGKHVFSSIGFFSNITYWTESGYFDAASHEKWLLHTWSLSAEWQFYIIYPLVLLILKRFLCLKNMKLLVLIGAVMGYFFSIYATSRWPNAAYYLLPTRAWEMMLGGVAFLYPFNLKTPLSKKLCESLGLFLIVASYLLISKETAWPGSLAIVPVLGSFLVIQAKRNDSFLTGNLLFEKVGLWSYSIYLWHWPFVVFIYYFSLSEQYAFAGILLSMMFGYLSHKYIESGKFGSVVNGISDLVRFKPLYIVILISVISGFVYKNQGLIFRFDHIEGFREIESSRLASEEYYMHFLDVNYESPIDSISKSYTCSLDKGQQTVNSITECLEKKLGTGGYFVIGDSHGRDFLHSLRLAYPNTNFAMLLQSGCAPASKKSCFQMLDELLANFVETNKQRIRGIVFSSKYVDEYGLEQFYSDISSNKYDGLKVVVSGPNPHLNGNVSKEVILNGGVSTLYHNKQAENDEAILINQKLKVLAQESDFTFFERYSLFCSGHQCKYHDDDNNVYFVDSGHLTFDGIKVTAKGIKEAELLHKL